MHRFLHGCRTNQLKDTLCGLQNSTLQNFCKHFKNINFHFLALKWQNPYFFIAFKLHSLSSFLCCSPFSLSGDKNDRISRKWEEYRFILLKLMTAVYSKVCIPKNILYKNTKAYCCKNLKYNFHSSKTSHPLQRKKKALTKLVRGK